MPLFQTPGNSVVRINQFFHGDVTLRLIHHNQTCAVTNWIRFFALFASACIFSYNQHTSIFHVTTSLNYYVLNYYLTFMPSGSCARSHFEILICCCCNKSCHFVQMIFSRSGRRNVSQNKDTTKIICVVINSHW